jgi:hypothetical protein
MLTHDPKNGMYSPKASLFYLAICNVTYFLCSSSFGGSGAHQELPAKISAQAFRA